MGSVIDRHWRLFGTGVSFAVFGIGGLIMAVFVFPVITVLSTDQRSRALRARSVVCWGFRRFLWLMHALGVADFIVDPKAHERLSAGEGFQAEHEGLIVVANHPTLIDVVQLLAQIEHGNCIVKQALWSNPFLGGVVRATSYISNDDSEELLSNCVEALKQGDTLVIFPEATRTVPGRQMKLRRGAAQVAVAAGVPVQFVHFTCSPTTLTKAERWYDIPPRRPCFEMSVGDRLDPGEFLIDGETRSVAARRLTRVMYDKLSGSEYEFDRDRAGH